MKLSSTLTDDTILTELGQRLGQQRLALGLTQAELAVQAGVSKRTVERVEAGASTQLLTLIRLLRVLGLVAGLEQLLPALSASPMVLLQEAQKGKGKAAAKPRQRASSRKPVSYGEGKEPKEKVYGVAEPGNIWHWGDET